MRAVSINTNRKFHDWDTRKVSAYSEYKYCEIIRLEIYVGNKLTWHFLDTTQFKDGPGASLNKLLVFGNEDFHVQGSRHQTEN